MRRKGASLLKFVSGDILQTKSHYIAQGVATGSQEGLGTGLAFKISSKWPSAQKQFKKYTHSRKFAGGDIFVVAPTAEHPGIIYLVTQPDMYQASKTFLNRALRNLAKYCEAHSPEEIALPKIGAGLGKLDWETDVKPLLKQHLADSQTTFYVYEDFKLAYETGE